MKYLKKLWIYTIIFIISIVFLSWYAVSTTYGTKIIILALHTLQQYTKYNYHIIYDYNKITGTFLKGLELSEIKIVFPEKNLTLHINKINFNINLIRFFLGDSLRVEIKNFYGKINEYPLTSQLNFKIKHGTIKLFNLNFIKFAENSLILTEPKDSTNIAFELNLNQLNCFNPNLTGNLKILGEMSKDLAYITGQIIPNNLYFNDQKIYKSANSSKNQVQFKIDLKTKPLVLKLNIDWPDLGSLIDSPEITRLKGKIKGQIELDFNDNLPKITTNLTISDITASLPFLGIKVKPMHINITSNHGQILQFNGTGRMRKGVGKFNFKGKINPFVTNYTNELQFYGDNMEFINSSKYNLIGTIDLTLSLNLFNQTLKLQGNSIITAGNINLSGNTSNLTKSKDISLINVPITPKNLKFLPDFNLRIEDQTRLLNENLDANISGKIKLYTANENNNTLLGEGRVTIKHGIYKLSGEDFIIEKGRIIYLPGTLITNPLLDIKVLSNRNGIKENVTENFLYIEGTLEQPIVKDSGLINGNKVVLHLLNLGNNKIINNIKKKFNLKELEFQEDNNITFLESNKIKENDSLLDNKNIVISKEIMPNTYLKYLKPLTMSKEKIKLEHKLNSNWSVEIGSSLEDGYGGDLRFFKETK